VGLFLNAPREQVHDALDKIPSMLPQFHGQEEAEYCDSFNRPYIKALGVGTSMPSDEQLAKYSRASGFLLDSNEPGALGGTGHTFDWSRLEGKMAKPLVLAGGLNVDNVQRAILEVGPSALDVSSGVELSKGVKCANTMKQFMRAVEQADAKSQTQDIG
jgi:phosphoribosylanthranilate isomerase